MLFLYPRQMNQKQLEYFVAVAECGSIAAAARQMEVAQPAISQQLMKLEHALKSTLVERDHRGARLTESGERFLLHAQAILRQIKTAREDILQSAAEPGGVVAIGMNQAVGNVVAVPLLELVRERYPKIELDLYTGLSPTLMQWLRESEVDVLLTSQDNSDTTGVQCTPILREKIYLVASMQTQKHPELLPRESITFAELAKLPVMVTSRRDSLGYALHQYEQQTGIVLQKRPAYGQLMTTLRYVTDGDALLLAPSSAFFHLATLQQVHVLEVIEPEINRDVFIMRSLERPLSHAQQAVIECLQAVVEVANTAQKWCGEPLQG